MDELLGRIARAVAAGKIDACSPYPRELAGQPGAAEFTRDALAAGVAPGDILGRALIAGMKRVGERFRDGEVFLPEVLMAARAMTAALEHLKPAFLAGAVQPRGTILLGTVAGDLHDIGKRIVALFFEGGGWRVIDLGVDVGAERFLAAIEEHHPQAVGLSTLLTTTMASMEAIAATLKREHPELPVVVGGAPVTAEFAARIGADRYSPDPQGALDYLNAGRSSED